MEKISIRSYKILPLIILSSVLLIGFLYSGPAKANSESSQSPGQQLAYFIGYHSGYYYGSPPYYYHRHYKKAYWTGWRYIGYGCRSSCLIDRWSGRAIKCKRICR
ncbi:MULTISPECIES: hypothetical protein [Legionella]|uniref:Uncharacterized protein n=1 Tax=Legionella resiliens TaxID=2905958 RepID=A0ABS8X4R3_9GAMM|nr:MULTISPECIES: hypothetical protein [unclassified Legionella]MCE0723820.1 hypothetical protein [Legionella sp. 9fVS26]MCE3532972.1 hypothetical protein [Legionella sp. 8cVS16]QLZ69163.1 hypothetical protein FOLKNPGA_01945 [Legionella sp. PC1000]